MNEIQHKQYVPILKAKEGEFKALQDSFPATKDSMTPLLEIVGIPWDYAEEQDAKTIDEHLSKISKKILDAWGTDRKIFVDSNIIDGISVMLDGTTHHLVFLFNEFRRNALNTIPVTGLERHADYKRAVQAIHGTDKKGICLRIKNEDLPKADLKALIDADLAYYNVSPAEVDLIIDLDTITGTATDLLVLTISNVINNTFPYLQDWRTFTLASSAFPPDLSDIRASTIDTIDRLDWQLWRALLNNPLKRIPAFGDYSIAHPEVNELDPRMITMSASIRYTADDYWLIVRGRSTKQHGYIQYHALSLTLIARPEYCGSAYSWGDDYIDKCAAQTVGTGNPTTWRRVANNHHFQKVITQLSNLPAVSAVP